MTADDWTALVIVATAIGAAWLWIRRPPKPPGPGDGPLDGVA